MNLHCCSGETKMHTTTRECRVHTPVHRCCLRAEHACCAIIIIIIKTFHDLMSLVSVSPSTHGKLHTTYIHTRIRTHTHTHTNTYAQLPAHFLPENTEIGSNRNSLNLSEHIITVLDCLARASSRRKRTTAQETAHTAVLYLSLSLSLARSLPNHTWFKRLKKRADVIICPLPTRMYVYIVACCSKTDCYRGSTISKKLFILFV